MGIFMKPRPRKKPKNTFVRLSYDDEEILDRVWARLREKEERRKAGL